MVAVGRTTIAVFEFGRNFQFLALAANLDEREMALLSNPDGSIGVADIDFLLCALNQTIRPIRRQTLWQREDIGNQIRHALQVDLAFKSLWHQ